MHMHVHIPRQGIAEDPHNCNFNSTAIQFAKLIVPIDTPTSNVQELQLLQNLTHTCYILSF